MKAARFAISTVFNAHFSSVFILMLIIFNMAFYCDKCPKKYESQKSLNRHHLKDHEKEDAIRKTVLCSFEDCSVALSTRKRLVKHLTDDHKLTVVIEQHIFPVYDGKFN